jgi:hypothetical protein
MPLESSFGEENRTIKIYNKNIKYAIVVTDLLSCNVYYNSSPGVI